MNDCFVEENNTIYEIDPDCRVETMRNEQREQRRNEQRRCECRRNEERRREERREEERRNEERRTEERREVRREIRRSKSSPCCMTDCSGSLIWLFIWLICLNR